MVDISNKEGFAEWLLDVFAKAQSNKVPVKEDDLELW